MELLCHLPWKRCCRWDWRYGEENSLGHIRSERSHVTNPHDYAALAKQLCSNVQIEIVAKSEIDQQFAFLDAKWEGVMAVPQTHRVHCIQVSGADQVKVADTSNENEMFHNLSNSQNHYHSSDPISNW